MFNGKKRPVLTATLCSEMEHLRLAIEVLTGQRVRFVQVDFNTNRGRVSVGLENEERDISFFFSGEDLLHLVLGGFDGWNTARFDWGLTTEVRVMNDKNPNKRVNGEHTMWWVGRSATDRWEEPLEPRRVEYCALIRGLTVEKYLKGEGR